MSSAPQSSVEQKCLARARGIFVLGHSHCFMLAQISSVQFVFTHHRRQCPVFERLTSELDFRNALLRGRSRFLCGIRRPALKRASRGAAECESPARKCRAKVVFYQRVPKGRHHGTYLPKCSRALHLQHEGTHMIPDELRENLIRYSAGIGKGHRIPVLCAGSTANHAHLLIALPATIPLAKAVQILKADSSRWLSEHGFHFAWQDGY